MSKINKKKSKVGTKKGTKLNTKKTKSLETKHETKTKEPKLITKLMEEEENQSDTDLDLFTKQSESDNDETACDTEEKGLSDQESIDGDEVESHKQSLQKLMKTDPDFYQFLQENDKKLLNFDVSDSDNSDDEGTADDVHKPTVELEIASDESDYEDDVEEAKDQASDDSAVKHITLKLIRKWQNDLKTDKTNKTISCLINAFHAAILRVAADDSGEQPLYKVDGSAVFNAVVQVCVLDLGPAVRRFLGMSERGSNRAQPHKCKRFPKLKTMLKGYFTDLLQLLQSVSSANILTVILKHLHYMSPLLMSYLTVTKPLLKQLVHLWGTGDETVRVVAFLCILRITNNQQQILLDTTLKTMYMTYVKNSKFVSVSALPMLNFMRRSLVEIFALDVSVSYHHVFLYIRQLAIHLRNAITIKKKENVQVVYNWQYVNSLRLWSNLLSVTCNKPQLQPLIYPFVQICLGSLKLLPTTQYYPLRFHITQMLIDLSRDTGVFIPILPFLLEVLSSYDFNKKHQKVSMKPLHFTCILRVSKSQLIENGFKDTIIDTIYGQILQYLANQSNSIAFPDLSFTPRQQLKQFVKKCSVANYIRKIRQLADKIEQNALHIERDRKKVNFHLTDFKLIEGWETTMKNNGTPLQAFYETWDKLHRIKRGKQATGNVELGEYNLPVLQKGKKPPALDDKDSGPVVLFPSDDETDEEEEVQQETDKKRKRGKRAGKAGRGSKKMAVEEDEHSGDDRDDIVNDIDAEDW